MVSFQEVAHCLHCGFQWSLKPGEKFKRGNRRDITRPPSIVCPLCDGSQIRIEKERE